MCIEVGAIHLVLNCLGIFTHHSQMYQLTGIPTKDTGGPTAASGSTSTTLKPAALTDAEAIGVSDDRSHAYWAKGTGFGTGSTSKSWDVEQALLRQKTEEEHVTVFLQVLSSYINPGDQTSVPDASIAEGQEINDLPSVFFELLQQSCLIPALSSYLRNDSVLDITRHIPLYRAILQLLRAIALSGQLVSLLLPGAHDQGGSMSIAVLLANMKSCVDTYASRLK